VTLLGCPRETEIRTAAVSARWTTDLRTHTAGCPRCADIALVTSALVQATAGPVPKLDPAMIWTRARMARRLHAEAQVSRVVAGAQIAGWVFGLVVIGFFFTQFRPEVPTEVGEWTIALVSAASAVLVASAVFLHRLVSSDARRS